MHLTSSLLSSSVVTSHPRGFMMTHCSVSPVTTLSWVQWYHTNNNYSFRLKWNACHACVIGWAEHLYTTQQVAQRKPLKGPWNQAKRLPGCLKEKQPATPRLSSSACIALGLTSKATPNGYGVETRSKCERQHKEVLALLMQVSNVIIIESS